MTAITAASLFAPVIWLKADSAVSCRWGSMVRFTLSTLDWSGSKPRAWERVWAGRVWRVSCWLYWFSIPAVP